jgi:two-component system response regulator NreC
VLVMPDESERTVRIVVADDHQVVRTGLKLLLDSEPDFEVVAEAGDVASATRTVLGYKPDVLVLDLNMPDGSSLPAIPRMLSDSYLHPAVGARIASAPPTPAGPPGDLTEREVEILRLIALGHTNAEIAEQLFLSVRTVESHRARVQQKTGLSTRAELVRYALDNEIVER